MKDLSKNFLSFPRSSKRMIAIITDVGLCIVCTWLAFIIRLEELVLFKELNLYSSIISIILAIPIFWLFGLYRTIFRYTELSMILTILASICVYGLFYFLIIGAYSISQVPRSIGILQPMLLFFAIITSRLCVKLILTSNFRSKKHIIKRNILVYGAGEAGRQLVFTLENSREFRVVGFLDDDVLLQRQVLLGKTIYSPEKLERLITTKNIDLIFLAFPSVGRSKRNKIIENLNKYKLKVKTLPSISEIVDDQITISNIKDLNVDDLLGRREVKPDIKLLNQNINTKTVLVTGAGGSIGSELCRQIIRLNPLTLILLELNEYSLYTIYEEIKIFSKSIKIVPLLANTQNQEKLETIFEVFNVDTVYHSAAYKHVSLVEENICEGVKNNVFSTLAVVNAAIKTSVSNFVLISSDKAVRPTNIMGATKRLSELCVQGIYNYTKNINCNFSIVRFGNVLESSGSVIPKFKKQIKRGGPVTLTHKDVTRYFMTITEAAQLVIQAGAMGTKCEVFILDMGESIKIKDLIYRMVSLSGLTVKDSKNLNGDIEVTVSGLKSGEKLHEELLIGDNPQKTHHEKIQKANDPYIPFDKLNKDLELMYNLLENNKVTEVKHMLAKLVPSYQSNSKIVDFIHGEKLSFENNK